MAKKKKGKGKLKITKGKKGKGTSKGKAAPAESHEYGVDYLADKTGLLPATIRRHLRDQGVAKDGKVYGWSKKSEVDAIVKKITG